MNYKELFHRLVSIITSPKKAWIEISTESPQRDVMGSFVYPLIALCGIAVLLNTFFRDGLARDIYQPALMDMCRYCVSLFGGFFLAAWLLDIIRQKLLEHTSDLPGSQLFVGYTMGVVFLAEILTILLPQFFIFKWILQFYVLYVVWEGCEVILGVEEEKRLVFTGLATASIVFSPVVIQWVFNTLSNLLG